MAVKFKHDLEMFALDMWLFADDVVKYAFWIVGNISILRSILYMNLFQGQILNSPAKFNKFIHRIPLTHKILIEWFKIFERREKLFYEQILHSDISLEIMKGDFLSKNDSEEKNQKNKNM